MTATALRTTLEPRSETDTQLLVLSTQQTLGADRVYRLVAELSIAGTVDPVTNEITLLIVMADQTQSMTLAVPRPALPPPQDSQGVVSDAGLTCRELEVQQQVNSEVTQANQSIHQQNDELFLTLGKIFDARDPYVGGHAAQVATYAVAIAQEMGLPAGRLEQIRQAGYLHDIGKMAIPEAILHKAGKLTDDEFEIIKTHAVLGAGFLETSHELGHLAPFVRHHHERWDGRGYPDGVQGEAIPIEARILNVCDSVEAMASDRPYHTGRSVAAIIDEVRRCAGTQFDPMIAELFIRIATREGNQFVVNSARLVEQKRRPRYCTSLPQRSGVCEGVYQATS